MSPGAVRGSPTGERALPAPDLRAPPARRGVVRRTRILRLLQKAKHQPIISLVAPPGYGKTTVLAQWAADLPAAAAWVTVEQGHNDPVLLFAALATALVHQGSLDPAVFDAIASRGLTSYVLVGRLLSAVRSGASPARLVIDDLHLLTNQQSLDALAELLARLPVTWQVAIAGRGAIALPLARWRTRDTVLELGPAELAMDEVEASRLVRQLGVVLSTDELRDLVRTSKGWPAIIYLAALATRQVRGARAPVASGSHPSVADYLRSELLGGRTEVEISFLTRTAILDDLTGPLCDAVVERDGSAQVLRDLAGSTLLVDARGGSYRYHSLLREFLLDELKCREIDVAALHRRAAAWYERERDIDSAVQHAFAAGDLDHAAAMVGRTVVPYRWSGRRATTRAWLRRFDDDALAQRPWLAILAAIEESGVGDLPAAEHLATIVERSSFEGRPHDGTASFESGRSILRALMCRTGVADLMTNASRAVELESSGGGWRDVAVWALANARLLGGDIEGADASLADAVAVAGANNRAGTLQVALSQRAQLAIERGDWTAAAACVERAGAVVEQANLDGYQITALTRATQARIAIHRGDLTSANEALTRGVSLRPQLTAALPWLNVQGLVALARAHLAIADLAGARTLLSQARDIIRVRPDLGTLPDQVVALHTEVNARPTRAAGATSLTAAELRVLQFLPLYLSFKEIGQRLGVRASTVQTHAVAIYGKLGASSRGEAVDLAIAAHLLEAPPNWTETSHHAWDAKRFDE